MAAATKTLTPTNQVVNLPDMTERPNASVLVDDIGKNTDAINTVHGNVGKLNKLSGVESIAGLGAILLSFIANKNNDQVYAVHFSAVSTANANIFSPNAQYGGHIVRYSNTSFTALFSSNTGETISIGTYNGGTNYFYTSSRELLNSKLANSNDVSSVLSSNCGTIVVAKKSKIGYMTSYLIRLDVSSAVSANSEIMSGFDVPSGGVYGSVNAITNSGKHVLIDSNGGLICEQALSNGDSVRFTLVYIANSL